jgi:TatD DNase family protein
MFDTHCHIQFNGFKDDYEEVIKRCKEKDCVMFAVGTQKDTSKKAVEFAQKYENIYAIVGLHPIHSSSTEVDEEETGFTSREEEFDYEYYKNLASQPKVVGIGECGIELFHIPQDKNKEDILEKQKKGFLQQIKLAQELNLPMSIHVRDPEPDAMHRFMASAYEEVLSLIGGSIKNKKSSLKGVIHCYTGNWQTAQKFLDFGFYLGFTGVITFPARKSSPKATSDLLEVVKKCPLDRMIVETDSPYLAPQAYRGQRCEPWMVEEVVKKIAEIRDLSFAEMLKIAEENTRRLFGI